MSLLPRQKRESERGVPKSKYLKFMKDFAEIVYDLYWRKFGLSREHLASCIYLR